MYKEAAKVIIDMRNEVEELEKRFGQKSRVVVRNKKHVEVLSKFYDFCERLIKEQHHALKLMKANYVASQMIRAKRQGTTYQKMAEQSGLDPTKWKILDEVDDLIRELNAG